MRIQVEQVDVKAIELMRDLYRQEANCQIICDSLLGRGLATPYEIVVDGRRAGYGGVRTKYDPGRVMEFYILPHLRASALPMFWTFLEVSQATEIEAQTNVPLMISMLYDCATDITEENVLFADAFVSHLKCPDGTFRRAGPEDAASLFSHKDEPIGEWVLEAKGVVVATGGFLCHYNPPYGDVFMEVAELARRQGYGSYLVQEIKRVCYEAGRKPVARCNSTNSASRQTLQKAGLLPCGRKLAGKVKANAPGP